MALNDGQIPKLANVINSGVAAMAATTTAGALGSNINSSVVYTAGAFGGRVMSLLMNSNLTTPATTNVFIFILRGGATVVPIGLVPVPVSSGNVTATRNVDALNNVNLVGLPFDNTGRPYIPLSPNDVLKCSVLATITVGTVWVTASGADYQS